MFKSTMLSVRAARVVAYRVRASTWSAWMPTAHGKRATIAFANGPSSHHQQKFNSWCGTVATLSMLGWLSTQLDNGAKSQHAFGNTIALVDFIDQALKGNLTLTSVIDLYKTNQPVIEKAAQKAMEQGLTVVTSGASVLMPLTALGASIHTMQESYGNGVEMDTLKKHFYNLAQPIFDSLKKDIAKSSRDPGFQIDYEMYHKHIERMETDITRRMEKLMSVADAAYWRSLWCGTGTTVGVGVMAATGGVVAAPLVATGLVAAAAMDGYNVFTAGWQWRQGKNVADDAAKTAREFNEWEVNAKFG